MLNISESPSKSYTPGLNVKTD